MNTTDSTITENPAPQTSPPQARLPDNIDELLRLAAEKLREKTKSHFCEVQAHFIYISSGNRYIKYVAEVSQHPIYFSNSGSSPDKAVENVIKDIKCWRDGGPRPYIDGHGVLEQILESIARYDKRSLNAGDDMNNLSLNCHLSVGHTNTHVGAITRLMYQRRFFGKDDREKLKDILRHVCFDL